MHEGIDFNSVLGLHSIPFGLAYTLDLFAILDRRFVLLAPQQKVQGPKHATVV